MVYSLTTPSSRNSDSRVALVSVVVPVYNTPAVLVQRAISSVLGQTHANVEIIIVDDGSDFDTAMYLDQLAQADGRARVIHRSNGGVSAARNTGVENALGEYVAFLDADDYLAPSFLSSALDIASASSAEIVFGGIQVLHPGGDTTWRTRDVRSLSSAIVNRDTVVSACVRALSDAPAVRETTSVLSVTNVLAALYLTDLARQHSFIEGVSQAEDRLYNLYMLLDAKRIVFCTEAWYTYDQTHEAGATRSLTPSMIDGVEEALWAYADVDRRISERTDLTPQMLGRIRHAAANGALSYFKVLTGVMSVLDGYRANVPRLRRLTSDPGILTAVSHSDHRGLRDRCFVWAVEHRQARLLLLMGWAWARTGGLTMHSPKTSSNNPTRSVVDA
jgi:glycosyltransferase involved in cell wall biosynthesis